VTGAERLQNTARVECIDEEVDGGVQTTGLSEGGQSLQPSGCLREQVVGEIGHRLRPFD
jgi:hypothetical protein